MQEAGQSCCRREVKMPEWKVLNKYHPPNFHLSMLPRVKLPRDPWDMVLLMTSVDMRYEG